jgi:hypothetical protein
MRYDIPLRWPDSRDVYVTQNFPGVREAIAAATPLEVIQASQKVALAIPQDFALQVIPILVRGPLSAFDDIPTWATVVFVNTLAHAVDTRPKKV